jgi:four helix bundle protein
MAYRNLNVLDAAERAAQQLNELIDRAPPRRLLHVGQMRDSMQSVAANISEGFGRATGGRDRARSLEIARGETEETIRHLNANFGTNRIDAKDYWSFRNLLVVIARMLNALLNG